MYADLKVAPVSPEPPRARYDCLLCDFKCYVQSEMWDHWRNTGHGANKVERESQPVSAAEPPQEQSSDDGWEDYWASLDRDSQDKLRPHIDGIRAWFTIGMVWGKGGRVRELSAARYKWQAAWQQASWERNKARRELSELRAAQSPEPVSARPDPAMFEEWLGREDCPVHWDESANKNAWYGYEAGFAAAQSLSAQTPPAKEEENG